LYWSGFLLGKGMRRNKQREWNWNRREREKILCARTSILICINPHSSSGMILLNAVERTRKDSVLLFEEWVTKRMQNELILNKVKQTEQKKIHCSIGF
jgi:hypothetical protein